MEDRERRLDVVEEPFVMVVADDDQYVGIDLRQTFTEHVELALAAPIALAADVEGVLLLEMLALAELIEPREIIGAGAERQRLVLAVDIGAEVPLVRRGRQERTMRRAKPKDDLGHAAAFTNLDRPTPRAWVFTSQPRTVAGSGAKANPGKREPCAS